MIYRSHLLVILLTVAQVTSAQWTWVDGDKSPNELSHYGTQGNPASANIPGSRMGAATWTDKDGNLWLFGGYGKSESSQAGQLSDLWKFNPSSKMWIWVGGNKNINARGTYGSKGVSSVNNLPGARQNAVSWTDSRGNFWLFGGLGMISTIQKKDDTKKDEEKDKKDNDDKHKGGNGRGNNGGGNGHNSALESSEDGLLNDLWMYSPVTHEWTFVSGKDNANEKGEYGKRTESSASNFPGARASASGWNDGNGNLWLFGGRGYSSKPQVSHLNDVWKYSPTSNKWVWMKGSNSDNTDAYFGVIGTFSDHNIPRGRRGSTAWTDNEGNFWLYGGGSASHLFGDLWKYNPHSNQWAWVSGSKEPDRAPVFKSKGVPDGDGHPGSRIMASGWTEGDGDLWLFGGYGYGSQGGGALNNLWKYNKSSNEWTFIKGENLNKSEAVYGTRGEPSNDNNPGGTVDYARWKDNDGTFWIFGGQSSAGLINQTWKFSVCETEVNGSISPSTASICKGGSQELIASGGTAYQWLLDTVIIADATGSSFKATAPGTYSVIISNGGCGGTAVHTAVITEATSPVGSISPATASVCGGSSQLLTATGGTSYTWLRDGTTISGETGSKINVTQAGTYSVIITNGNCTGPATNTVVVTMNSAAGIRYADVFAMANAPAQLNAREIGVAYEWTPAIGLNNTQSVIPMVTTGSDRQYIVKITTEQGCIVSDTVLVKVNNDKKVVVPTAFTPNGNGRNDLLRPLGNLGTLDYFRVFNRWGAMLFQTNERGAGWDGRYKGVLQPADTYTWLLSGTTADGQPMKLSGKSLLIR